MLGPLKSGLAWPSGDVTVSLGSVGLFRRGCGLDLPIAVAILTAAGTLPADPATGAPVGRGAAGPGRARIRRPPLRVPDHRATIAAVTGGGTGLTHIPGGQPGQDTDALSAALVAEARDRMGHRLSGTPWLRNGDIPRHELARTHPPAGDGQAVIDHAIDLGLTGSLAARHITAVAWTLTDLAGRSRPGAVECAQALAYWAGAAR
jgi:predicted ATPase with chaperone activity